MNPSATPIALPGGENTPDIAVIIGAYSRSEFLIPAVQSVLKQDIGRARMELLVTKNFVSDDIDSFLKEHDITILSDPEPLIGTWLTNAIRSTRAPLIALLDDDDEFEPNHLSCAIEAFRTYPNLGYYRNRMSEIGRGGCQVERGRWGPLQIESPMDRTGSKHLPALSRRVDIRTIPAMHPDFNASTMVFRREILTDELADKFRPVLTPDLFIFACALLSPYGIYIDQRRLTRYRVYKHTPDWTIRCVKRTLRDSRYIAALCRERGYPEYGEWFDERTREAVKNLRAQEIFDAVRHGANRRDIARLLLAEVRTLPRNPKWGFWDLEVTISLACGVSALLTSAGARGTLLRWGVIRSLDLL